MAALTKAQLELARDRRHALRELSRAPNGSGAICVLLTRQALEAFVRRGLAEKFGQDRLGDLYRITKTGLAALAAE